MALAFPAGPTPGQQFTGPNGVVYEWDSALGAWVKVNSVQAATAGTTAATGAARIPSGPAADRPTSPANGFFRFNEDTDKLEVWSGLIWAEVASSNPITDTFVPQTKPLAGTPSAVIPSGDTAGRQTNPLPLGGYTRFNTDTTLMEVFDGLIWTPVGAPPNAGLGLDLSGVTPNQILKAKTPYSATPPPLGTLALQAIDGSMYWDTQYGALFVRYNDGTDAQWVMVNGNNIQTGTLDFPPAVPGATYAAPNGLTYTYDSAKGVWTCPAGAQLGLGLALDGQFIKVSIPTASTPPTVGTAFNQAMVGSLYWDDVLSQLFIRYNNGGNPTWVAAAPSAGSLAAATLAEAQAGTVNLKYSSPETAVPKNASGMTGSAYIPAGNTAARPAAGAYAGQFRYNTQIPQLEYSDGTSWIAVGSQAATLAEAAAGTLTTKYLSPETGVPKNASGMTGSALIPAGNSAARPAATLYAGQLRYNNQIPRMEYSNGTSWLSMAGAPGPWANFNGTTAAIRQVYDVSSVTKVGTGSFRINFATAAPTADYSVVTGQGATGGISGVFYSQAVSVLGPPDVNGFWIITSLLVNPGLGFQNQDYPWTYIQVTL